MTWWLYLFLAQASAIEQQRAAAAIQREAARKHAEMVAQRYSTPESAPESPASADCDPIPEPYASALLGYAANAHAVDPKLLRSVVLKESGFRPCAVSPKGAMGLMQLMPATVDQFHVADAFDAKQNIEAGAKYLKQLLEKYKGDLALALAAYNAGPAAVDKAGGVPNIQETRDYVESITRAIGAPATPRSQPPSPTPKPIGN